jgi:hypothetical protein
MGYGLWAVLVSIPGFFRSTEPTSSDFLKSVCIAVGWGAGGIIGAVGGIGHILEVCNQSKSSK